jgi:hypothetical protein
MLYKYCPPSLWGLDNFRKQQIICRHYADFNDPFEFWSRVVEGIPTRDDADRFRAAVAAWGFSDPDNAEDHEEYFESLVDGQPPFSMMFDHTRIACFCAESTNLLLWSHYADGLRGFCIGFDESQLISDRHDYLTEVEYLRSPPTVDSFLYVVAEDQWSYHRDVIADRPRSEAYFGPDPISDEVYQACADEAFALMTLIWRRAFAVKPLEWAYERETRLLVRTGQEDRLPLFRNYPATAVREIIIGERMDAQYREGLLGAAREICPQAKIMTARRSRDAYALSVCS